MVDQTKRHESPRCRIPGQQEKTKKPYQRPEIAWEEKLESTAFMGNCLDGKQPGESPQCDAIPFT